MESQTFIKEKDSFIIAIAAVSGGGKTEITKALFNRCTSFTIGVLSYT
ncbi:hypothetical protein MKX67_03630 [Cytobacillus sp. FSL W7-1323]|nr:MULTISPECIES: hypothetical protein [Cytobacillus]MCA1029287.1 hypothetical protein [Cytobacillus kochii]MCM3323578.1 hypothetical protein [Cytobacillus kochii]MCM3345973.1 hypothetical protein [Cytobacillus kochii]MEA1854635.1 hypothetical protein [Cytobacillus sp. OWB-43]